MMLFVFFFYFEGFFGDINCYRSNNTLEFLYMTSFGAALNSSGSAVGIAMALEKINTNSTMLADYQLEHGNTVDSQVRLYIHSVQSQSSY